MEHVQRSGVSCVVEGQSCGSGKDGKQGLPGLTWQAKVGNSAKVVLYSVGIPRHKLLGLPTACLEGKYFFCSCLEASQKLPYDN